ncbi:hypothetical protein [Cesiribacter andamanensis]|uniref:Uncharacterized protein n=1 Tax=Cesiribacter andamanensis AMV16 TaxID=1279009 RepID=M7N2U4_9BACT|nr:hypothetical protein [Cesiribacter andamanensis]EMR02998.1 hypothetical protein ADICEAN_01847 [Cesiribacter andamanensis AMV16]
MKNRWFIILIVVLYTAAALSLLGVGVVREKLKEQQALEQSAEGGSQSVERQTLQNKFLVWQGIAVVLFGSASLLLVFRHKLVKETRLEGEEGV